MRFCRLLNCCFNLSEPVWISLWVGEHHRTTSISSRHPPQYSLSSTQIPPITIAVQHINQHSKQPGCQRDRLQMERLWVTSTIVVEWAFDVQVLWHSRKKQSVRQDVRDQNTVTERNAWIVNMKGSTVLIHTSCCCVIQAQIYLTSFQVPATRRLSSPGWPGRDGSWIDPSGHPTSSAHVLRTEVRFHTKGIEESVTNRAAFLTYSLHNLSRWTSYWTQT